jgi:hypothetical protein
MTEAEWLTGEEPDWLVESLYLGRIASDRKYRLFTCACCLRLGSIFPTASLALLSAAEAFCDGLIPESVIREQCRTTAWPMDEPGIGEQHPTQYLHQAALCAAGEPYSFEEWEEVKEPDSRPSAAGAVIYLSLATRDQQNWLELCREERSQQMHFLRDVFGNPFRPVAFDAKWRTDTVVSLAKGMYESRDFSATPILADALQDAGCGSADILDHCRGEGVHVRGCWVIDLLLEKE